MSELSILFRHEQDLLLLLLGVRLQILVYQYQKVDQFRRNVFYTQQFVIFLTFKFDVRNLFICFRVYYLHTKTFSLNKFFLKSLSSP